MTRIHSQVIKLARRTSRAPGGTGKTLERIGDKFGLTGKSVGRILRNYSKKTGYSFGFRQDARAVPEVANPEHGRGKCLLCKRLTSNPVDRYLDNPGSCPACNGTGWYRAEIMLDHRREKQ